MTDHAPVSADIAVRDMRPDEAPAFRRLNLAWIEPLFGVEAADRKTLDQPKETVIDKGGAILLAVRGARASRQAEAILGCVALIPIADGGLELAKMAVAEEARGAGLGAALIEAAVARARALGAPRVYLETSSRLPAAIRLYERMGFTHEAADACPPSAYARCDRRMALVL